MSALESIKGALEEFILNPDNHDFLVLLKAMRNGVVYGTKVRFPHALVMTFMFRSGSLRDKILAVLQATRKHATNLALFAFFYKTSMFTLRRLPSHFPLNPIPTTGTISASRLSGPAPTRPHRKEYSSDAFLSGLLAGYAVFGRPAAAKSSVTQQIVIYVFARVCLGLAKLAITPARPAPAGFQAGYSSVSPRGGGLLERLPFGIGDAFRSEQGELLRRRIQQNSWPVFASVSWGLVMWLFRWYPDLLQPSLRSSMKYLYEESETWTGLNDFFWHAKS